MINNNRNPNQGDSVAVEESILIDYVIKFKCALSRVKSTKVMTS